MVVIYAIMRNKSTVDIMIRLYISTKNDITYTMNFNQKGDIQGRDVPIAMTTVTTIMI